MQERIAEEVLGGSLSNQNVTTVGDILTALANSSGQRQLETFITIMKELLEQLGQEVNLHLMTAPTGEVRLVHCTEHIGPTYTCIGFSTQLVNIV